MGKSYNHLEERETLRWKSIGKFGKGPVREILIKDISDEHLMKIIEFIGRNIEHYKNGIKELMEDEVIYRVEHKISVPEYYGKDDPGEDPDFVAQDINSFP